LSQFHDKLLFVAPEIKSDLKIEQAEFQSIVSGEDITINVKNRTAFSKVWKVPGALAGNEVPSWCDNSGSIARRIVLFDFSKSVTNGDMRLADKLASELPSILMKCNRLYLDAVSKWSTTNIWTVLPKYFLHTRDEMAQSTNVLEAFLSSEDVIVQDGAFCSLDDFKSALKVFATQNNYAVKRFSTLQPAPPAPP
jgi:phage/plasmid-associated DNA primase